MIDQTASGFELQQNIQNLNLKIKNIGLSNGTILADLIWPDVTLYIVQRLSYYRSQG